MCCLKCWTMGKFQRPSNPECYTLVRTFYNLLERLTLKDILCSKIISFYVCVWLHFDVVNSLERLFLKKLTVAQFVLHLRPFMDPEYLLPCLQNPTTGVILGRFRPHCPSGNGNITPRSHSRPVSSWNGPDSDVLRDICVLLSKSHRIFPLRSIYSNTLTSHHTSDNIFRLNFCNHFSFPITIYMSRPKLYPVLCWFWCLEIGFSSMDLA